MKNCLKLALATLLCVPWCSAQTTQGSESNPVVMTIDLSKYQTNINDALNSDKSFTSTYSDTTLNLFLYQHKTVYMFLGKPLEYYINLQVSAQTLPQTGGTINTPATGSSSTFDPTQIQTAQRYLGVITFGLQRDTRYSLSVKASGPYIDLRVFDYVRGDNRDASKQRGAKIGWLALVPIDEGLRNLVETDLGVSLDQNYSEKYRVSARIRYNLFAVKDGGAVFVDISANQSVNGHGPTEIRYGLGTKMNAQKLIAGALGL